VCASSRPFRVLDEFDAIFGLPRKDPGAFLVPYANSLF